MFKIILKKTKILFAICLVFMISCNVVFEEDLSNKSIALYSPTDSLNTPVKTHTFWWSEVEFATYYQLQIVSSSFDEPDYLVLDTAVSKNSFVFQLLPGNYQWRVSAGNSTSSTKYKTHSLTVDTSRDISYERVILISPAENHATNQNSLDFSWNSLYAADYYQFSIEKESIVIHLTETESTAINVDISQYQGDYKWNVKAINEYSSTQNSTNSFEVDTVPPLGPTLIEPENNSIQSNGTIAFSWERNLKNSVYDSLYIYEDELLQNIVKAIQTNSSSYSDSIGLGDFYWRVKTIDKAGNIGGFSQTWKVIIQE